MDQTVRQRAIERTIALCGWTMDTGDAAGYAACFTADGELVVAGQTAAAGAGALADFASARAAARPAGANVRHHASGITVLAATDDTANVRTVFVQTMHVPSLSIGATGWYDDEFVRDGDAWIIKRRVINIDS